MGLWHKNRNAKKKISTLKTLVYKEGNGLILYNLKGSGILDDIIIIIIIIIIWNMSLGTGILKSWWLVKKIRRK